MRLSITMIGLHGSHDPPQPGVARGRDFLDVKRCHVTAFNISLNQIPSFLDAQPHYKASLTMDAHKTILYELNYDDVGLPPGKE